MDKRVEKLEKNLNTRKGIQEPLDENSPNGDAERPVTQADNVDAKNEKKSILQNF